MSIIKNIHRKIKRTTNKSSEYLKNQTNNSIKLEKINSLLLYKLSSIYIFFRIFIIFSIILSIFLLQNIVVIIVVLTVQILLSSIIYGPLQHHKLNNQNLLQIKELITLIVILILNCTILYYAKMYNRELFFHILL